MNRNRTKPSTPKATAPKAKQSKAAPTRAPKVQPVRAPTKHYTHLSEPAKAYARLIADPISGPLACIPVFPALFTARKRLWVRGTMSTGTTGFGFVVASPKRSSVSDQSCVGFCDATYAGSVISVNTATTGVFTATSNAEYTSSQLGSVPASINYRVVAAELRFRYIGTELDRGGQIQAYASPVHVSLSGETFTSIGSQVEARKFPVNREWVSVLYKPATSLELDMQTSVPGGEFYMALLAQAASPTTPSTFEWELWVVHEYQGPPVKGQTESHFDPTGFSAVHQATQLGMIIQPTTMSGPQRQKMMVKMTESYLGRALSWITNNADDIGATLGIAAEGLATLLL